MFNRHSGLREFGNFRVDIENKFLWHNDHPVDLPLKALELLCVLTEKGGAVVSKEEMWHEVWPDSCVEETNLTHSIYLLRKALRQYEDAVLIQTVPRRGYRFAAEVCPVIDCDVVMERRTVTRTVIEEMPVVAEDQADATPAAGWPGRRLVVPAAIAAIVVCLSLASFGFWRGFFASAARSPIRSIAVIPFTTVTPDSAETHQGLGMADILITRLSSIREIRVRPTSAVANIGAIDAAAAGKLLQVDAILEGTIYRTDQGVRVTARLVHVGDGSLVWSGEFEKPRQDELRLQNEIALQVVDALALNLSGSEQNTLTKNYTDDRDAFDLYTKGRFEWNKRNAAGMIEAERLFRNAIKKDPNFALAYVGLADKFMGDSAGEGLNAIQKALELDPNLAEAHASLGFIKMFQQWKWQEAEHELKRSIELNPGYATAHHWYAELLAIQGRNEEAKAEMLRALEINPISYNFLADLGQIYYFNRQYKAAEEYCLRALEIYPDFSFAHEYLEDIYMKTGDYDKAVEAQLNAQRIYYTRPDETSELRHNRDASAASQRKIYREGGYYRFFENLTGETQDASGLYVLATRYAFLGNKEKALLCLEKAFEGRGFLAAFIKVDPVFDDIRHEPRFQKILSKMGL